MLALCPGLWRSPRLLLPSWRIVEGKPLQREWLLLSRGLKEVGKAVWLQRVSEQVLKNSEFLKKCLVRRWGVSTNLLPGLGVLKY